MEKNRAETKKNPASRWSRIGRGYNTIALIGFNTIVLIVVLLIIGDLVLPEPDDGLSQNTIGIKAVYSVRFNRGSYSFMSPEDVDTLLNEYDLMANAGHWQVHPWTGLTMRRFIGQFLNIDPNGQRLTIPVDVEYQGKTPLIVWAFGGSTLFGWGLADDFTLPSQLQVELQERLPERQVQVHNFAVPIFNSSQELALFVANLRRYEKPQIVFFLDGVNDVWFVMYQDNQTPLINPLANAWESALSRQIKPGGQPWVTFNPTFPPTRLAEALGVEIPTTDVFSSYYALSGTGAQNEQERLNFAIYNYQWNRQMVRAIARDADIAAYFFLQPWNEPYYPAFREAINEGSNQEGLYDISDTLENDTSGKPLYVDDFHYSDYATQVLAQRIADIIMATYPEK